jgi:hypothetical protein
VRQRADPAEVVLQEAIALGANDIGHLEKIAISLIEGVLSAMA